MARDLDIWKSLRRLAIIALTALAPGTAQAGGGPENIFVVVNPRSWSSLTVANHFCQLRKIPPINIFYLDWGGSVIETDVERFRQEILSPILSEIDKRKLGRQIDYVAYSTDFPYAIDITEDLPSNAKFATGSLTSLTFMAPLVMAKRPQYTALNSNWYMRAPSPDGTVTPTQGFRAIYAWARDGQRVPEAGQHYMLSTMLAYTSGRGNSVTEAVRYLRRSALADASHSRGTIYFVRNSDIRSEKRHNRFPVAVKHLRELGVKAEIVDGIIPQGKTDVQGAVVGKAKFSWSQSGSTILAGAICENFTSFGGRLRENGSQTPLSVFMRHGAAGSSGTVDEPYSIQEKFPDPMIQVHYARGCTLAEAFYQSVYSPYQLLIVGDPLCRPWATIPTVEINEIEPGDSVSGTIRFTPVAQVPVGHKIGHLEIFLDGRRIHAVSPGNEVEWDTRTVPDGFHELRVVAVEDSLIQSQGRMIVPLFVNNRGRTIDCKVESSSQVRLNQTLRLTASSPDSAGIVVFHNRRLIGKISGEQGSVLVPAKAIGLGPSRLYAVGLGSNGGENHVFAQPIHINVQPETPMAPNLGPESSPTEDGLSLVRSDGESMTITSTYSQNWLGDAGVNVGEPFRLNGYFQVRQDDVYQFQLGYSGSVNLFINGKTVFQTVQDEYSYHYVPLSLQAGWHQIEMGGEMKSRPHFSVTFGGRGSYSVGKNGFKTLP